MTTTLIRIANETKTDLIRVSGYFQMIDGSPCDLDTAIVKLIALVQQHNLIPDLNLEMEILLKEIKLKKRSSMLDG